MKKWMIPVVIVLLSLFTVYASSGLKVVEHKFDETSYETIHSGDYEKLDTFHNTSQAVFTSEDRLLNEMVYPYYYGKRNDSSVVTLILIGDDIKVHHVQINKLGSKVDIGDFNGHTILVSLASLQISDQWCMTTYEGHYKEITTLKQVLNRHYEERGVDGGDTLTREIFRIDLSKSFNHRFNFYNRTTFNDSYKEMKFTLEIN